MKMERTHFEDLQVQPKKYHTVSGSVSLTMETLIVLTVPSKCTSPMEEDPSPTSMVVLMVLDSDWSVVNE
jgi:hypothetical protein